VNLWVLYNAVIPIREIHDSKGVLRVRYHYLTERRYDHDNEVKNGVAEYFNAEGKLHKLERYENGKRHGLVEEYEDGVLIGSAEYENGKIHGKVIDCKNNTSMVFDKNKLIKINYSDDEFKYTVHCEQVNGKSKPTKYELEPIRNVGGENESKKKYEVIGESVKIMEGEYETKVYNHNEFKISERYKNNELVGKKIIKDRMLTRQEWYTNGLIRIIEDYLPDGTIKHSKYENGVLFGIGIFRLENGRQVNIQKTYYNPDGTIKETITY
jgi:antitoxin component YwqK of YwqJK toxin-antitoxin module